MPNDVQQKLIGIETRHQLHVEMLKSGMSEEYVDAINDDIETAVILALSSLGVSSLGELSLSQIQSVINKVSKSNRKTIDAANIAMTKSLIEFSGDEVDFERQALIDASGKSNINAAPKKKAFDLGLKTPLTVSGRLPAMEIEHFTNVQVEKVSNTIRKAWSDNLTPTQAVNIIVGTKKLNKQDGIIQGGREGINKQARAYVNTQFQHVETAATLAVIAANAFAFPFYRIIVTLDSRTSRICIAEHFKARVYRVGKGPIPPLHYYCRSTIAAVPRGANPRITQDQIPFDFMRTQKPAFIKSILGPTRTSLLLNGGMTPAEFAALDIDKNFIPISLKEMRKINPLAFEKSGLN